MEKSRRSETRRSDSGKIIRRIHLVLVGHEQCLHLKEFVMGISSFLFPFVAEVTLVNEA